MPDDITLKVQLDTRDLERDLKQSVKSGIQAGAKEARAELANKRTSDLWKQKTSDRLMLDQTKFANQRALISDKESSTLKIIAKRAEDKQKERADKARIKVEEDARRLNNAKEMASFRESLRREREDRRQSAVGGIFGSIGSVFDSLNPAKRATEVRDFLKDYKRGKGMRGSVVTDPYAVSEGFGAGYTGKGALGGVAKIIGPAVGAVGAMGLLFKKTVLNPALKVGKQIVGYFTDIAKQAETLQAIFNLIALPFKTLFTMVFAGPLMAFIPVLKEMMNWIASNQEVIQRISDTFASAFTNIFTEGNIGIVSQLMDKFASVLQFLADSLAANMSMVNTESVSAFIATTISAVVGFIQDVLMGIVAFCYSPEGQAFLVSMAEGIGKLIGSLIDILLSLLPVFAEMAGAFLLGVVEGIVSTVGKAVANLFDLLDKSTGGAITGFVNGIIAVANWFIDRINDVIGLLNNIPFVEIGQIGRLDSYDTSNIGSNFGQSTATAFNNNSISNTFTITNNNNISNNDTVRSLMMTGL